MFDNLLCRPKQYGFAVIFAGVLMAQPGTAQVPHTDAPLLSGNSQLHINNWRVLGPFQFSPAPASADVMSTTGFLTKAARLGLSADYLLGYYTSEQRVTATSFPKIARSTRYSSQELPVHNSILQADPGTHILTLLPDYTPVHFTVSYAASVIDSPVDQDIVLAVGVEDTMRVTLNGSVIYDELSPNFRLIRKVQNVFGAHLHRGANFLLVKQTTVKRKWLMTVTAYPRSAGLKVAREAGISALLRSAVIPLNHSIGLRGDLVECHKPLRFDLEDADHQQLAHFTMPCRPVMRWQPPPLAPNQVYFVHGLTDSGSTTEPFYYGSTDEGYRKVLSEVEAMHISDEEIRDDIATPLSRLRQLLLPENKTSEFWKQKTASLFLELHSECKALAVSKRAFLSLPGTHLRAYRSSVDAQVQNYWIHVPARTGSAQDGLPLIFVMPGTPLRNLPFLESFQATFYDEIKRFEMVSDEYGAVVVQINGRGKDHGGTAIWESEIFDVLKAISANYPLDKRRIYLMGECEGGRQALLLAERHPGLFAAVAVIAPMPIWRHSSVGSVAIQPKDPWAEYASTM